MPIRKHRGINQTTGKLKAGYVYTGTRLKGGLAQIKQVKKADSYKKPDFLTDEKWEAMSKADKAMHNYTWS